MLEDQYLIQKILKGNYAAFNLLISRNENYVYAILINLLKNKEDAEEAFQDTFMKIYKALPTYNQSSKFTTWAYRIAYNTGLDYLRKRKRTDTDSIEDLQQEASNKSDDEIQQSDLTSKIQQLLGMLGTEEEQIVRLYYLEELSVKEVSDIIGIPISTIKTKLFRARKRLHEQLTTQDIDELKSLYRG